MFKNLNTREKLLFNMILSQIGLIGVGVLGYLGYTMAAAGVVVLFSIMIAYSSYLVMDSTKKGIKKFDNLFEEFINFVLMKQNRIMKESSPGNDDIGKMISKVNDAIDTLQTSMQQDMQVMGEIVLTTDKIEQGIFQCKVKGITTNPMLATLKVNMNKMIEALGKTVSEVSEVANSYANDDFTKKIVISSAMRDEMRLLLESVNTLGDSLSNNAKSNLSNGQQLDINSQTMTESVNSLASKANQQAASLEETAAVEEITSITRNNAGNATKMSTLGQQVQDEVQSGMNLAGETSSAMDQINEQVRAINESITVIDQIAFQTNILSLNAAVEAATAGESGKGFAVVAGEVRNLASRSADAANEIKALVEQATIKANDGKSISDRMISSYESLNENFTQTMDLIEDVSSASKEQMTGIEQINDAVATLDKMTQENAHEANSVANTAFEVSKMAKSLVSDAKTKRFNDKIA